MCYLNNANLIFRLSTEIAAAMSDDDVPFSAETLSAAFQMRQIKQLARIAATRPVRPPRSG